MCESPQSTRCGRSPVTSLRAAMGQSETNVTTEPWSAVEWIADTDLTRASFYWGSVPHCRNPPSACQARGRASPCSDCAKQRHDIIPNRLALTADESVSGVTGATAQVNQETPPMRIYIIGNDGITLCREPAATVRAKLLLPQGRSCTPPGSAANACWRCGTRS